MIKRIGLMIPAAALLVTTVGGGEYIAPEHEKFEQVETGEPESSLSSTPTEDDDSGDEAVALSFSPAGCVGQTDHAHWSSGNMASVHGRTECAQQVVQVGVTTTLQQRSWLIWQNRLSQTSQRQSQVWSGNAAPHWDCNNEGSRTYRGVSTHWSIEDTRYEASTVGAAQTFAC